MTYKTILIGPEVSCPEKPHSLVVFVHGLGADGNDLIGLAHEFKGVLGQTKFISPNAPYPCDMAPYGYQWFSLQQGITPEVIGSGVKTAAKKLNQYLDALLLAHDLESKNLVLIGFSQGAMTALYASLRRKSPLGGVIAFSGAFVHSPDLDSEIFSRPPVLLVHGAMDMVVPPMYMSLSESALKYLNVPVQSHLRPALAHGIDAEGINLARTFLVKHLGGKSS